jgi:hypothetical protein
VTASDTLARTLYGEARGGGTSAMAHVANVVCNRAANPRWWGRDIESVCRTAWQFSCWNPTDPNRPKLLAVTAADPEFAAALDIAARAVAGTLPDETGGADSYFALTMKLLPAWTAGATHTLDDGWHSFWITRCAAHAPSAYRPRPVLVSNETPAERLNAAELASVESQGTSITGPKPQASAGFSAETGPTITTPKPAPAGTAGTPTES